MLRNEMTLSAIRLNRRHKFILFLTLIATGASLVMGAGLARAAGIAMLGTALAWILGLNTRVVHWLANWRRCASQKRN